MVFKESFVKMNVCIVCRKFCYDKTISIDDTIDCIKIKNMFYDLNFKFPFGEYMSKYICTICCYNLGELYKYRDYCCELLLEYAEKEYNNCCRICCRKPDKEELLSKTTIINRVILTTSDILKEICSYEVNVKSSDILCTKCYNDLIIIYDVHLKCIDSLNFWTTHVLESICKIGNNSSNVNVKENCRNLVKSKLYGCGIRLKSFANFSNFQNHLRTLTDEKPNKCKLCLKSFTRSKYLKYHLRIHTGEKPYKCSTCLKSFKSSSDLRLHLRVHTGERPYKCKICLKSFTEAGTLKTHLRIHTGKKPFKCEICLKLFTQSGHLKDHSRIHTGERPYKCEICSKSFVTSSNLKRHLRTHSEHQNV